MLIIIVVSWLPIVPRDWRQIKNKEVSKDPVLACHLQKILYQRTILSLVNKCITPMYSYIFYLKYMAGIPRIFELHDEYN